MPLQLELAALVLVAALLHAVWNALVKSSGDAPILPVAMVAAVCVLIGLSVVPFLAPPHPDSWPPLALSIVLHQLYFVMLAQSYRFGDLGQVYPLARGSAPLLVAAGAFVVAGEALPPIAIGAVVLISFGILSLTFERGFPNGRDLHPVLYALATACLIAAYTVVDGIGVRASKAPVAYTMWLLFLEGWPLLLYVLIVRHAEFRSYLRTHWVAGTSAGAIAAAAYTIVLFALAHGAMAQVSALRETSVIFAAVIGAMLLKEGFGRRRMAAAAVVTTGIATLHLAN